MSLQEVRSPGGRVGMRERTSILTVTALVIGAVGLYLTLRVFGGGRDPARNLLPYQTLARTLTASEQQMFTALRGGLPDLESERARTSRWPEPVVLAAGGVPPFSTGAADGMEWQRFQQSATVNYIGLPAEPSAPAWLLMIQEPEPNQPPDPAPLDEEHHRLPDGTTLHIYVWMHRYGGRIGAGFVPQPQTNGWTEVFTAPPNPILSTR
ncbi:MAG: hypothetical protein GEU82_02020 [Luteitalea sp.]|nr:hypothetical protein [Luteitalea sp.]